MSADDFNDLGYHEQTEAILRATFLAGRALGHYYIKLYNLHNFYVEVFFNDESQLITHMRAFRHTRYVMPYLEELKIAV